MDKFTNGKEYNNQFTQEEVNNEIWKDIQGYEGLYKVSSLGRVKSSDRVVTCKGGIKRLYKGKILSIIMNKSGYFTVFLYKDNSAKQRYTHQLVAQAFIPNPNNLLEVNHIDEDKSNNRVSNLEWCTREYNCNYGTRNERKAKAQGKPVIMYDMNGNKLKEFDSMHDAERFLDKPHAHSNISMCCSGRYKSAYGYKWKYK